MISYLKDKKDFIPLALTTASAFYFLFETITESYTFTAGQITGFLMLSLCAVLHTGKLKAGILSIGMFFILCWTGLIGLSAGKFSFSFNTGNIDLIVYKAHPLLFCLMVFHLIISAKHYVGIATKKYWQQLFSNNRDKNIQI